MSINGGNGYPDADALDALVRVDRIVGDLTDMTQCASVNPFDLPAEPGQREAEFGFLYRQKLAAVGLDVSSREIVPGRSNVWGKLIASGPKAGQGPTIMLAGHLDTVGVEGYTEPFSAHIVDGRLYGRGACDMKAALAAYLEVIRVINEARVELAGDLVIAGICDEEHKMIGSLDMGSTGPFADVVIIGEPTDLAVCSSHKGQICLVISTYGTAVHSSRPELGVNAIVGMADVIQALGTYAVALRDGELHPLCGTGTTNPGVISGGTISSTVPDVCRLEIDRRTLPGQTLESVLNELHALLEPLRLRGLSYDIGEPTLHCRPLDTRIDHPLVTALTAAASNVLGRPISATAFPAATDAPNLGIPSVICGPGSLADAHTLNESVAIDDVVGAVKIYLRAILALQPV